jgi:hypothetical protein
MRQTCASSLIVLDFETTGLSPNMGDRAIEIGAVRLEEGGGGGGGSFSSTHESRQTCQCFY